METQAVIIEDGQMIDPITGELIETQELENAKIEQLPQFGRALASIDRKIAHRRVAVDGCTCLGCNLAREIERLEAIRDRHIERLEKQRNDLKLITEGLLTAADKDKVACPGIGTFRFRKSSAVDTAGFDALDDQAKTSLYNSIKAAFKPPKPFVVIPDKAQVKRYLKDDIVPNGFRAAFKIEERRTFNFEAEK